MGAFSSMGVASLLLLGALSAAVPAVMFLAGPTPHTPGEMSFWEAAGRDLLRVTMVDVTYDRGGHTVVAPLGIRIDNDAGIPVAISEEPVLMSPHPLGSSEEPFATAQDAVLTSQTIPAGGSLLLSYGEEVLRGFLDPPMWWCSEEFQSTRAGVPFYVGGETAPFAVRELLANPYFDGPDANTQADFWTYLRTHPTVVVGKVPLWARIPEAAGQRLSVTVVATNLAVFTFEDSITVDVNVTAGVVEDDVPAGWDVEAGSYSVEPDEVVDHADGSRTLRWFVDLPAAPESEEEDPRYPTEYEPFVVAYVLVSPDLTSGRVEMPRARFDTDGDGIVEAHSAIPLVDVVAPGAPIAHAGGPYSGIEGDVLPLSAEASSDPEGDPLLYRWDLTNDGVFETDWSSDPVAFVRYTDDYAGLVAVEVTDGTHASRAFASVTIANAPPRVLFLDAVAQAAFRLEVAGERWHEVRLSILAGTDAVAIMNVVREPGSPSAQSGSTSLLTFALDEAASLRVEYTPDDDRVNGRPPGDNPVWLTILFPDGREARFGHNFNTQRPSTWVWAVDDLVGMLVREGVVLRAGLFDVGSDDLHATWDFGGGRTFEQTFYNDGVGPDGPESQDGTAPFQVLATTVHSYRSSGTLTLVVRDDDGGAVTETLRIDLP